MVSPSMVLNVNLGAGVPPHRAASLLCALLAVDFRQRGRGADRPAEQGKTAECFSGIYGVPLGATPRVTKAFLSFTMNTRIFAGEVWLALAETSCTSAGFS